MVKWRFWVKTLGDISRDELEMERRKLRTEEERIVHRIEKKDEEKKELFMKGVKEQSAVKDAILARRMMKLDRDIKDLLDRQGVLSKRIRVLNRLNRVKTNKAKLEQKGVWKTIRKMPIEKLDRYTISEEAESDQEKDVLRGMLEVLEGGPKEEIGPLDLEEEERDILDTFKAARETGKAEEVYAQFEEEKKKEKEKPTEEV